MNKIFFILVITLSHPIFSEFFFEDKFYDFESRMDFFNVPAVSLSVITDNEIQFSSTYGITSEDMAFQASSFSKPLTSLAVFKLVESGILDLDTDVNRYLKSWKIEETAVTRNRKVTLRLLLSHTSGIHESGPKGYVDSVPILDELLENIHIRYYPGLKRRYSWSGYTIIQKIIEDVTDKAYEDYMSEEILLALGMDQSSYVTPVNHVNGHDLFGEEIDGGYRLYPESAASGLWSTPGDIAKYLIEIQKIRAGDYEGIISKKSIDEMLSYQTGGWGLGVSLKFEDENLIFRHSGKNAGFTNYFISRVKIGEAIVIMTNGDNAWKLIMEILHSIKNYEDWGI